MTYSGWIKKKRGRWIEVCRDADRNGCWKKLLAMPVKVDCEREVTPTGTPPIGAVKAKAPPGLFDQEASQ